MRDRFTVGFTYFADIYCGECGDKLPERDPEGNMKHPVASWDTADLGEQNCGECGLGISEWR